MTTKANLGKNDRLKSRKQIERLFKQGKSFAHSPFRIYFILEPAPSNHSRKPALFGAGVSTRNFKKAVDRNRIKRLTREAYRLQSKELKEKLLEQKQQLDVFFIYTGKELPEYKELYNKTTAILKRLTEMAPK